MKIQNIFILLFIFCFLTNFISSYDAIDYCDDSVINTFKGLQYVNPDDIDECNFTIGVNSYIDQYGTTFDPSRFQYESSGGGYYGVLQEIYSHYVLSNVDYDNFNVSFTSGTVDPIKIITEFDDITVGGVPNYLSYYNNTHLIYSSTTDYYIQYSNETYDSEYIAMRIDTSDNIQIKNIDGDDFISSDNINTSIFYDGTYTSKDNTAITNGVNINNMWQYWVTINNDYAPQYIMGYADPLKNYIVKTGSDNTDYRTTSISDNLCTAYLVGDEDLLQPELTYAPYMPLDNQQDGFVMSNWYSTDFSFVYLWNGTNHYVKDKTYGFWWFVPSFTCADFDTSVTVTMLKLPTAEYDEDLSATWNLPVVPLTPPSCLMEDENYSISTTLSKAQLNYVTVTWINGTNTTVTALDSETTKNYDFTFNTTPYTNLSEISYYINSQRVCRYSTDTTLLGIASLDVGDEYDWLTDIIFLVTIAISLFSPFFIIFSIVWNDVFLIVEPAFMGGIIILIAFTSSIIQYVGKGGNFSMKNFAFFTTFGILFIIYAMVNTGAGIDPETYNEFGDLMSRYSELRDVIDNPSPAGLLATSFSFILSLVSFFLFAPAHFVNFIISVIDSISPPIAEALYFFSPILIVGIYVAILSKGYELLANRYLEV